MKTKREVLSLTLETKYLNSQLWENIQQLNLLLIFERMLFKYKWSKKRTEKAIVEYRQFLYLTQVVEFSLSPTKDIDAVWHEHILHTNKYSLDCKKLFGKFLHHFPTPVAWIKKVAMCDGGVDCRLCNTEEDEGNLCNDLKPKARTRVCDGGGGPESRCNTCTNNPPKPEPKCAADCKSKTIKNKSFCGVEGDGKPGEDPKPKPDVGSGGDCNSGSGSGGDCDSQRATFNFDNPGQKPRRYSVSFADLKSQFFVLN